MQWFSHLTMVGLVEYFQRLLNEMKLFDKSQVVEYVAVLDFAELDFDGVSLIHKVDLL